MREHRSNNRLTDEVSKMGNMGVKLGQMNVIYY